MLQRRVRSNSVHSVFGEHVYGETIREAITRRLQDLVRNRRIRPGERLPAEPELARMLHVSRSSLREALKGLEFLGAISARPGRGTFVSTITSEVMALHLRWMVLLNEIDYVEILGFFRSLQGMAAAEAARRASPGDIEKIKRTLGDGSGKINYRRKSVLCNMAFHDALGEASHNRALQTTIHIHSRILEQGLRAASRTKAVIEKERGRHGWILAAIERHDASAAREAVEEDLAQMARFLRVATRNRKSSKVSVRYGS